MYLQELALGGKHNIYNSMAAAIAAKAMDIDNDVIRNGLATFQAVEHRLEKVVSIKDVLYINDSKATNVNSCWYALESMTTPTVLILGGTDKGNVYSEIDALIKENCHTLIFMGKDNSKLIAHFEPMGIPFVTVDSLEDAVQTAYNTAKEGETVLLSPCCASFDLFKNMEDRGEQFVECCKA